MTVNKSERGKRKIYAKENEMYVIVTIRLSREQQIYGLLV